MARRAPLVLLVLTLLALMVARSAAMALPPAPPDPSCSPGPSDCGAWHTSNVTVNWAGPPAGVSASGCGGTTISSDTGGAAVSCTWSDGSGSRTTTVIVRRDASPPAVTASPERGPDSDGWYNRPVSVSFSGEDATSGVAGCSSATYSGPDTGSVGINGSCTDYAGNQGGVSHQIKYDATAPTVQAKANRNPDMRGWYNRELTVAFEGSDPTSGVSGCDPPVSYRGPDSPKTAVSGTCTDKAANKSAPAAYELRYDTKPPRLARVKAEITGKGVLLKWTASKDSFAFGVVRRPGLKGKKPSTLYTGKARAFTDRRLQKGIKYRYTVTAYDEAGNAAFKGLATRLTTSIAKPAATKPQVSRPRVAKPALTRPAAGARLQAPPLLAWRAVPNATYYNVQLYHNGQKILTLWPTGPSLLLQRSWKFAGRTYRLTPGRYRWYVWPGFGKRAETRYGKLIGSRTFVVTR